MHEMVRPGQLWKSPSDYSLELVVTVDPTRGVVLCYRTVCDIPGERHAPHFDRVHAVHTRQWLDAGYRLVADG